jgi:hypothetical protein
MKIGMLWFDNDPQTTFEAKVQKAIDYYEKKYERKAIYVYVHPAMLAENASKNVAGITIVTSDSIRPNHFWVGSS